MDAIQYQREKMWTIEFKVRMIKMVLWMGRENFAFEGWGSVPFALDIFAQSVSQIDSDTSLQRYCIDVPVFGRR
jgi:hypothetical protein